MKPQEIEASSFQIIDAEAGPHGFSDAEWSVVRRMIHTSADFEYAGHARFHKDAISSGIQAIRAGKPVVTDTEMVRAGIRRASLNRFQSSVLCRIRDPKVADAAQMNGTTRALEAVNQSIADMAGGIYAIGNAPTALIRLIELVREKKAAPALILGFPVGFVNAAESKDMLLTLDIPFITSVGRKGGSNIAASVVNALIILAEQDQ